MAFYCMMRLTQVPVVVQPEAGEEAPRVPSQFHLLPAVGTEQYPSADHLKGLSHEIDFKNFDKNLQN
jgi:hypothetical protein